MGKRRGGRGLRAARLLMVLSSISPLFILWGIRGVGLIEDRYFLLFCGAMVLLPNAFLAFRIKTSLRLNERRELTTGVADDHRQHLLVYLFAMLLPFYAVSLTTWRELAASLAALAFIVFLFWHLNLHYMNLIFAARGYRVFTVSPPQTANEISGKENWVLITKRITIPPNERITAYRLSDTVYLEIEQ